MAEEAGEAEREDKARVVFLQSEHAAHPQNVQRDINCMVHKSALRLVNASEMKNTPITVGSDL